MSNIPPFIQAWIEEKLDQAPDLSPEQRRRIERLLDAERTPR
jgi:hypothetical protein